MKKKGFWLLLLTVLLLWGAAAADVYNYDEQFSLRYPHGWTLTEDLNAKKGEYFVCFDGDAQGRPTVEMYATYSKKSGYVPYEDYVTQLQAAYANYQVEILAPRGGGAVWKGVTEYGPIAGISGMKDYGWHFTFILHGWADESKTAYREPTDQDLMQLCYFYDHIRTKYYLEHTEDFTNKPVSAAYQIVTYTLKDGTEIPFGMPEEYLNEDYTKTSKKSNKTTISVYEDLKKKYLDKKMVVTTDKKGVPSMVVYSAKGEKDEEITYDREKGVWLIKTYLGVEHGYVNEQGFWTRDLYQGDQLTKRTWFENGTKFEAHYENGKLAETYGTGPDGIEVRYNVRGEKTEATYYNEKGLEVRDSYTNDQVSHRMYYDDAGMHVNETYNEAGELKEISYDYTDIYGERQNFSKGFGAREEISFVGDTQITTNYREDETMERRITFGPELTTIETFDEKGELIEKTVNGESPRSEGGFVLVLQSKTYLNEDGKWILEMYDEQKNIISTEETMKPE